MQTRVEFKTEVYWLDPPEVTRLEALRLSGWTSREALNQILDERRGEQKGTCPAKSGTERHFFYGALD